jgi:hypothetical protein
MKPETSQNKPRSGEKNYHKQKLWRSDTTQAKSPLSVAAKHPDFQVTSCFHFVTTNVNFACTKSE